MHLCIRSSDVVHGWPQDLCMYPATEREKGRRVEVRSNLRYKWLRRNSFVYLINTSSWSVHCEWIPALTCQKGSSSFGRPGWSFVPPQSLEEELISNNLAAEARMKWKTFISFNSPTSTLPISGQWFSLIHPPASKEMRKIKQRLWVLFFLHHYHLLSGVRRRFRWRMVILSSTIFSLQQSIPSFLGLQKILLCWLCWWRNKIII